MKLKELRERLGYNQTKLANVLNIPRTNYNKYELGTARPDIEVLIQIANFYNVSLDYLCDRQWNSKAYIEVWRLTDEQKANLYLIEKLNHNNNLRANGYLLGLYQEQQNGF